MNPAALTSPAEWSEAIGRLIAAVDLADDVEPMGVVRRLDRRIIRVARRAERLRSQGDVSRAEPWERALDLLIDARVWWRLRAVDAS